VSRSVRN